MHSVVKNEKSINIFPRFFLFYTSSNSFNSLLNYLVYLVVKIL